MKTIYVRIAHLHLPPRSTKHGAIPPPIRLHGVVLS